MTHHRLHATACTGLREINLSRPRVSSDRGKVGILMQRPIEAAFAFGVLAALVLAASPALGHPSPATLLAGKRLAHEYCGGCHNTSGPGGSPLPNAPPFRELFKRYPPGDLRRLLDEGMLAPSKPQEEGEPRRHPRMPMAILGDDQRAELTAYLHELERLGRDHRSSRP